MNERLLQIARCNTIADVKECMKVLSGLYVNFNKVLVSKKNVSARDSDSVVMMHMFYAKGASFLQLLDGFPFVDDGKEIGRIIEPTLLYSLARDMYEALCAFELVFVLPKTEEQKKIQSEIEAKMKAQMDGIVHAPYAFAIGEHISPIGTCDGDCPVTLSKIKG